MATQADIQRQFNFVQRQQWLQWFIDAASKHNVPLDVLLAVASRETAMGTDPEWIANNFVGSDSNSTGIMQISRRFHPEFVNNTPPGRHDLFIDFGAQLMRENLDTFNGNMKYALVAYNAGPDDVRQALLLGQDPDSRTTGGNYARDVRNRASIIRNILNEKGIAAKSRFPLLSAAGVSLALIPFIFSSRIRQWLT